jgi:hypothetical protein
MSLHGYSVFIMPKHGGSTLTELSRRHADALDHIARNFGERAAVFAEAVSKRHLVDDGHRHDPDFDRWFPLSADLSLVITPPPRPLATPRTPTLFMVARRGFIPPDYFRDLYARLPAIDNRLTDVDGSPLWMLSHASEAANLACNWFVQLLA